VKLLSETAMSIYMFTATYTFNPHFIGVSI